MDNLAALESTAANDPVVAILAASHSAPALLEMFSRAKVDQRHVLDRRSVVAAILETGDSAKALIVSQFVGGGHFDGLEPDQLLRLANMSAAHRCALLSNKRIDWY